jgi:hypothetical protein
MTSGPHLRIIVTPSATMATEQSRLTLQLKPKAPTTGYVAGAWWTRSPEPTHRTAGTACGAGSSDGSATAVDVVSPAGPRYHLAQLDEG